MMQVSSLHNQSTPSLQHLKNATSSGQLQNILSTGNDRMQAAPMFEPFPLQPQWSGGESGPIIQNPTA